MRFALAGISHETNTFCSIPTNYESFKKSGILEGENIKKLYESPSTIGGFYQASKDLNFEIVPLMVAGTGPLGTITADAFEKILTQTKKMMTLEIGVLSLVAWTLFKMKKQQKELEDIFIQFSKDLNKV